MPRESGLPRRRKGGFSPAGLLLLLALPFLSFCTAQPTVVPPPIDAPAALRVPTPPCVFSNVGKIVVVGDLHGAFRPFVEILRATNLVDRDLRWTGGRTHLVQMGDVMDRGPEAKEILDLIIRLQKEASEAGGAVHMLLGNHEEMNMLGLSFEVKGYVTPDQFRAFFPNWIRSRKDAEFRAQGGSREDFNRRWEAYIEENSSARNAYTNAFNARYGKWLSRLPIVLVINDIVFVHGGVPESMSVLTCETINSATAAEFDRYLNKEDFEWAWIYQPRGPLWYRDMALRDESVLSAEIDRILANLKARAIVVGHTPTPARGAGFSRFDEKVWITDTGIWMKEGGFRAALIIENGKFQMIRIDPREEVRR